MNTIRYTIRRGGAPKRGGQFETALELILMVRVASRCLFSAGLITAVEDGISRLSHVAAAAVDATTDSHAGRRAAASPVECYTEVPRRRRRVHIVEVGHGEEFNHTGWFQPQVGPLWHDMLQPKARPRGSSISSADPGTTTEVSLQDAAQGPEAESSALRRARQQQSPAAAAKLGGSFPQSFDVQLSRAAV